MTERARGKLPLTPKVGYIFSLAKHNLNQQTDSRSRPTSRTFKTSLGESVYFSALHVSDSSFRLFY